MNKKLYIIPGFDEHVDLEPYQKLKQAAEALGYTVVGYTIDFSQPLSKQVFSIEPDACVFGFSVGALMARLIAQQYPCKLLILGSSTPVKALFDDTDNAALSEVLGDDFTQDLAQHIAHKHKAQKTVTMAGDKEDDASADIIVPDTDHFPSDNYIHAIIETLRTL